MRILVDKMPTSPQACVFCAGYKESTWKAYHVCRVEPNYRCTHTNFCPFCKELVRGDDNDFSRFNSNDSSTRQ